MQEKRLSSHMKQRVKDFFDFLWKRNKGIDKKTILDDIPYCLEAEVMMVVTKPLMTNVRSTRL